MCVTTAAAEVVQLHPAVAAVVPPHWVAGAEDQRQSQGEVAEARLGLLVELVHR